MDNLNDLKTIWRTAKTDSLPGADEMLRTVKKFRNQKLRNKWKVIIISVVLIIFWIVFMWNFKPVMVSTWAGAALTVLSSVVLIRSL
jgi:t-SNARE complex subunit (syntaxin)